MKKLSIPVLLVLGLFAVSDTAKADFIFTATITHDQEVLPTGQIGTPDRGMSGFATLILNDAQTALTYSVTLFGIDFGGQTPDTTDNMTAAHIHAPGPPGVNAGIVFGFFGTPQNDNNPDDRVITPFATGAGGTITGKWDLLEGNGTTLGAQLGNLFAGNAYLNFHTQLFPGGEIRGQITGGQVIPEPSSIVLGGLGLLSLAGYRWRRRKQAA